MVNSLSKGVNGMTIRQYLEALAMVNPSLTYEERLVLLEPVRRNGAITERLKDWLDKHGIRAVINVSNRLPESVKFKWNKTAERPINTAF